MFNQQCPNCNYSLVLLSSRFKYKCSLCNKLFFQKEIDDKTFRQWNFLQRKTDKENLQRKRIRLTEEEKNANLEKYIQKNREILTLKAKLWREKNKENYNIWVKEYISRDKDKVRLNARIRFWRKKQRELSLQYSENKEHKPCSDEKSSLVPTFSLADQLCL